MIDRLRQRRDLPDEDFRTLLESPDASLRAELFAAARAEKEARFGRTVRLRGLIEVSNICRNDCLYCGIRRSNIELPRYRLGAPYILSACERAYSLGIRTFVFQGGENPAYAERLVGTIPKLRERYPDAVITLSLGELPFALYAALREAGAGRYLLRHETATESHYARLHPAGMSLSTRLACAAELRRLGFETGLGMMVGSPFQTTDHLIADLRLLQQFHPDMVGCGPFIPQKDTPFASYPAGSAETTLRLYAIIRLLLPDANIPSTTALRVLMHDAAESCMLPGLEAGANVLMPNFTPKIVRGAYDLYDGKTVQDTDFETLTTQLTHCGYSYV